MPRYLSVPVSWWVASLASAAFAQSVPVQLQTSPQVDPGVYSGRLKVDYPTPYEPASDGEIRATLERLRAYVDKAAPVEVLNADTGEEVTDFDHLPGNVSLAR